MTDEKETSKEMTDNAQDKISIQSLGMKYNELIAEEYDEVKFGFWMDFMAATQLFLCREAVDAQVVRSIKKKPEKESRLPEYQKNTK